MITMKNLLNVFVLLWSISFYGQEVFDNGAISIEYKSAEEVSNKMNLNSSTKLRIYLFLVSLII